MKLSPVRATAWKGLPEDLQEMLLRQGAVPVNEVFFDTWDNDSEIFLLYGAYGSGKSIYVADRMLHQCMTAKYFRGYFGRKVLDTVRGTIFQTFVDRIKELKLEQYFSYSEAPNGSMHIRCRDNGNTLIPFGANDPQSLKSIKDPTHFILEEMDQFSFEDFGLFYSRLRTDKAKTQLIGMFNTDRLYQSHWIRKMLFEGEFADQVFKLKAGFRENVFINAPEYEKKLRLISGGNAAKFNAIANGEMALIRTGSEFWKQFDETRHVKPAPYQPGKTVHITLDENVTPYVTAAIWQVDTEAKQLRQVHELPCKSPDNNAPKAAQKLVDWLQSVNYSDVVFIYGDPSASKRSTIDPNNRSFYDKFIEVLQTAGYTVTSRVQRSAPEVALSAAFINAIYEHQQDSWSIIIHERCFTSIEDYLLTKEDAEGKMLKEKEKDKETGVTYEPRGHFSDAKRYFITTILATEFSRFKSRSGKRRIGYQGE